MNNSGKIVSADETYDESYGARAMALHTALQVVLGLAKESAFTKTQVGTSPELNAVMQREQNAIAIVARHAKNVAEDERINALLRAGRKAGHAD